MAFLDLFRPRWRRADPAVRRQAIARLDDPATLARIAREDPDPDIRIEAVGRIGDPEYLTRLALTGPLSPVHEVAITRLADQAIIGRIAQAAMDPRVREIAVRRLDDQAALAAIARSGPDPGVRGAAAERISDPEALTRLAQSSPDAAVRAAAAAKLTDTALLSWIAAEDADPTVRLAAAGATGEDEPLVRIATEDTDMAIREAAVAMIRDEEALYRVATHELETGTDILGDQFALRAGQDAALARLTDEVFLAEIAATAEDQRLARAAIEKLTDPIHLRRVLDSPHWFAREAAIAKIDDPGVILERLAMDDDLDALEAAVTRLAEPDLHAKLGASELAEPIERARNALAARAAAETDEAGSERIITGSLPSAAKVAAQFERLFGEDEGGQTTAP